MELVHWSGERHPEVPRIGLRFYERRAYSIYSYTKAVPWENVLTTGNNTAILYSKELTKW